MRHEIIDPSQFELTDKVVSIKRVSKTVKGGRTMRFTALVVVGDGNGHIGAGLGKATEIPEAIRKGKEDAMKKLIHVDMDANKSVPHDFIGKFGGASVLLKVSSLVVRHVTFWRSQESRISVQSHLAPTTSRTSFLLRWKH